MNNAITISNGKYTVTGVVKNSEGKKKGKKNSVSCLHVIAYYKMPKAEAEEEQGDKKYKVINHNEGSYFLGIGVTNEEGIFSFSCSPPKSKFPFKKKLDLFLIIKDGGQELPIIANGVAVKGNVFEIKDVTTSTAPIEISVYLSDSTLRKQIQEKPAEGWIGGFDKTSPNFAYPKPYYISLGKKNDEKYEYPRLKQTDIKTPPNDLILKGEKVLKKIYPNPDFSLLGHLKDNLMNIDLLNRQQKVLWAEFSWKSKPCKEDDTKINDKVPKSQVGIKLDQNRCYKMFAPDISRLGYTKEGRVYSIICPQQGTYIPYIGTMNLEVTVTGNRGWVDEGTKELAAGMGVEAKVWFSGEAKESVLLRPLVTAIEKDLLGDESSFFPSSKEKAIRIRTFRPGFPDQSVFPLKKGLCKTFRIPEFAKHEDVCWTNGNLEVQIGSIIKTGCSKVDKFNQTVVDLLNINAGNMLKENNVLAWNVWFTAPEIVNKQEWRDHADKWRESIDAKHDSPGGPGTIPRYFDGTPLKTSTFALIWKLLGIVFYIIKFYIRRVFLKVLKYTLLVQLLIYTLPIAIFLIIYFLAEILNFFNI
ncbi:MAG: hypothetical protein JKY03_05040 [Aureispira sp.]|nr:hypothetical protein [Aureispira sp.]